MSTELEEKERAITVVERAALALGADEHEKELVALSKKYKDIVEIKNPAGRQQCHAAAMELGTARIATTKTGETAREDANAFQKAVIAEVKRRVKIISDEEARLLALRDAWDKEREAEKIAKALVESQRITKIRLTIDTIRHVPAEFIGKSSAEIGAAADDLSEQVLSLDFYAEYTGEAQAERDAAVKQLRTMQEAMRQHEEAQAELARKQADLVEQERLAGIARAEQEARDRKEAEARAAQERKDAAARAAEVAEQHAANERAAAAMRAEQAAHEERMAKERAEIKRQQDAIDAEKQRVADEAAARQRAIEEAEELEQQRLIVVAEAKRQAEEQDRIAESERVQAVKDAAEAERVRQVEAAAEAERRARAAREAADTAMRNAASALYAALISQVSWAGEVSDEFLDGEPGLRDRFVADRKAAADALKLARGEA